MIEMRKAERRERGGERIQGVQSRGKWGGDGERTKDELAE